jgi:hypothetical protein
MRRSLSRKRPWLAALLAMAITGLGHLYLRRFKRAAGWFVTMFAVSVLFVEPTAVNDIAAGSADLTEVAPLLVVGGFSVIDAYLLARAENAAGRSATAPDETLTNCPNCGEELDSDLAFCHWCSTELPGAADADADETTDRRS